MPFKVDAVEMEPALVMADNYNHYLMTYTDQVGMLNSHTTILRKFDQKNQLVNTYSYNWPKIDDATLYNYLGMVEERNGKVAVLTYTYSGRARKSEIVKHEFDKTTAAFTSTPLMKMDIENSYRSGQAYFSQSVNGNYIAVVFTKYRAKNTPEQNQVMVFDANFTPVWQKEVSFENEHTTQKVTVSDNGNVVLLRDFASFKKDKNYNYLVEVTPQGTQDKMIETKMFLHQPVAVSIGPKDFIVAFNSKTRGNHGYEYDNLMLYDVENGRILANNEVKEFNTIKDFKDLYFRHIAIQGETIELFTEAKQVVVKGVPSAQNRFPEDKEGYGPGVLYVLGFDGVLKNTRELSKPIQDNPNLYHSYGLLTVKGNYYINTSINHLLHRLMPDQNYTINPVNTALYYEESLYKQGLYGNIRQVTHYFADSAKVLLLMQTTNQELIFVNVTGAKL